MEKVLTLHQPWASLCALGFKWIETRSWKTDYRGPLLIHAGQKITPEGRALFASLDALTQTSLLAAHGDPETGFLQTGKLLGRVYLDDIYPTKGKAAEDYVFLSNDDKLKQEAYGDFGTNRFLWIFGRAERTVPPIPAKCFQRIWNYSPAIDAPKPVYVCIN